MIKKKSPTLELAQGGIIAALQVGMRGKTPVFAPALYFLHGFFGNKQKADPRRKTGNRGQPRQNGAAVRHFYRGYQQRPNASRQHYARREAQKRLFRALARIAFHKKYRRGAGGGTYKRNYNY